MNMELFFLRSSENKIVTDMVKFAHEQSEQNIEKYSKYYGLTSKDMGLYALVDNKIAGAIWSREFDSLPELSVAVVPEYRKKGVASFMMEQFLLEAASVYDTLIVQVDEKSKNFYEKFGFEQAQDPMVMLKKLQRKEIIRPSDGYDPRRWMD